MKKLVSICFVCILLTCAAGAAHVGTIDNGYPGDTEAQAQMLCDLGLFRGTENGFELEKPMTRAEAAAMLTRFFGAEQEALAGDWSHPFTDVPQWADKYVGWLYESGLTKGTSASTYDAEENVTCEQYNTFLARALSTSGSWISPAERAEINACDEAGFVRGDAVSLSARALGLQNLRYHALQWGDLPVVDAPGSVTEAWTLVHKGVFTAGQLKQAAWDVLPRRYDYADQYGGNSPDSVLSCLIAGVPVVRNAETDIRLVEPWEHGSVQQGLYGTVSTEAGNSWTETLYCVDEETLALTGIGTIEGSGALHTVCSVGGAEYFLWTGDDSRLIAVKAGKMQQLPSKPHDGQHFACIASPDNTVYACNTADGVYVLDADGAHLLPGKGEDVQFVSDSIVVTQRVGDAQTVLTARTPDGEVITQRTVSNPTGDAASLHASRLSGRTGSYVWGTAGLYHAVDGRLTRLSARPVVDCRPDETDGSLVIISYGSDEQPSVLDGWEPRLAGTEVLRISPEGTETLLLSNRPAHGLNLCSVSYAADGEVHVRSGEAFSSSGAVFEEYAIENGTLRALG